MPRINDIHPELTKGILEKIEDMTESFRSYHGWDDRSAIIAESRTLSGSVALAHSALWREYEETGDITFGQAADTLRAKIREEYPAISKDEPGELAYIRSADHYGMDRWTRCRIGRWINRVCPDIFGGRAMDTLTASHDLFNGECKITFLTDLESRIDHMKKSDAGGYRFGSCMGYPFAGKIHPYAVYSDRLGWSMAVMTQGGVILGRCMLNGNSYVRIYSNSSGMIDKMGTMLRDNHGIREVSSWEGLEIELIESDHGRYVGPYMDGSCSNGTPDHYRDVFIIDDEGPAEFSNQSGYADYTNRENQVEDVNGNWIDIDDAVEWNGDYYHENDMIWDEYNGESIPSSYAMRAYNSDGHQIYTVENNDDFIRVTMGNHRGQYHYMDNVVYVEASSGWNHAVHMDDAVYYEPLDRDFFRGDMVTDAAGGLIPLAYATPVIGGAYRLSSDVVYISAGSHAGSHAHAPDAVHIAGETYYRHDSGIRKLGRNQYVYFSAFTPAAV